MALGQKVWDEPHPLEVARPTRVLWLSIARDLPTAVGSIDARERT